MNPAAAPPGLSEVLNLAVYGPLGVMVIIFIITSVKFYLDNRSDRKEHKAELAATTKELQNQLAALTKEYQGQLATVQREHDDERKEWVAELKVLGERYAVKADTNIDKYHSLVEGLNRVLDSASRRYPRNAGRSASHGREKDDET